MMSREGYKQNIHQSFLVPQPFYPDSSDLSNAVPTVSSYNNDALTFSLPVVNQVQVKPFSFDFNHDHYFEPPDHLGGHFFENFITALKKFAKVGNLLCGFKHAEPPDDLGGRLLASTLLQETQSCLHECQHSNGLQIWLNGNTF